MSFATAWTKTGRTRNWAFIEGVEKQRRTCWKESGRLLILEEAAYLIELIQQDAPDLTAEDKSQVRQLKKFIKKWQDKKS